MILMVFGLLMSLDSSIVSSKTFLHHNKHRRSIRSLFNDPEFPNQYYLINDYMNIVKTWQSGFNGTGVTICINDNGVDITHPEFKGRFNLNASFNFGTNRSDPSPDLSSSGNKAHGTMMAGLAGATGGNGVCGVGVAFKASLSGIRIVPKGWDHNEAIARSLSYRNDINDIYSNSWGLIDFYQSNIGYMHKRVKKALKENAEKGRQGRGNIFVFAGGNGGLFNGTCSYNEYTSSIYTIGISVITGRHTPSLQNVKCTGVSAVTYGRDGLAGVDNPEFRMPAPGLRGTCSFRAAASSASAAVASGILGLVLQAKYVPLIFSNLVPLFNISTHFLIRSLAA